MATTQRFDTAYGLSQPLLNEFPAPLVANRAPTGADKAQLGSLWVNKITNDAWVLTSVINNVANWLGFSSGTGTFTSITVTPGDITVTNGDINVTLGDITAGGALVIEGNITSNSGNIIAATGNINATAGSLTVATDITTSNGNIVATLGNVLVPSGNITVSAGDITAVAGDIEASAGAVRGAQTEATGDLGGVVSVTSITNVIDTAQSTGTLSILSDSANPGTNAGFIKIYVGATTAYLPYFTNIAP